MDDPWGYGVWAYPLVQACNIGKSPTVQALCVQCIYGYGPIPHIRACTLDVHTRCTGLHTYACTGLYTRALRLLTRARDTLRSARARVMASGGLHPGYGVWA